MKHIPAILRAAAALALINAPSASYGQEPADPPVATVSGKPILKSELDRMINLQTNGEGLEAIPEEMREEARRQILEGLIADRLIADAVNAEKIEVPKEDVQKYILQIAEQVGGKERLESELAAAGVSMAKFREDATNKLRQERWTESQMAARANVTDEEIEAFYKNNPNVSKMPEMVRASHILLTFDREDKNSQEAKLKEIEAIREKILNGEDFALMAKQHSQDPGSKDLGGDLNYFARGRMVPEFEEAAFALEVGQVSGPVKTEFGYHLIRVTDHKQARHVSFDEAKDKIRAFLQSKKREEVMQAIIEELRARADVKVLLN